MRPLKVLIVDDNADYRMVTSYLLENYGHLPATAASGSEAIREAERDFPDVVLLDIRLPLMDGYVFARLLIDTFKKKPLLIVVTTYGQESDILRSWQEGFDYHFLKPADPVVLQKVLNEYALKVAATEQGRWEGAAQDGAAVRPWSDLAMSVDGTP